MILLSGDDMCGEIGRGSAHLAFIRSIRAVLAFQRKGRLFFTHLAPEILKIYVTAGNESFQ
jgi:hypothetical protein